MTMRSVSSDGSLYYYIDSNGVQCLATGPLINAGFEGMFVDVTDAPAPAAAEKLVEEVKPEPSKAKRK